ncbi:hypothetical protein ILUMI_17960 [Ignelater luminosus]|uniref:Odorant receptor n=1 Tax=Ignelater luminosus TaxID=2038154 RepID=A0A8K0CPJ0_IGNLU|nr:hypothetical protein ILUMI_17960 [Ignelater luminosus]
MYWTAVAGSVLVGFLIPLTKRIQSNDYHDWEFSYGPFTVFNVTYSPNYEMSLLFQTICMDLFAAYFSATDLITAAVLVHISFQFKLLRNYIKTIVRRSYKEMLLDTCSTSDLICCDGNYPFRQQEIDSSLIDWKYLKQALKNIVEFHLAIMGIANELENMFSSLLLLVFVSTLGLLALLVFRISNLTINDNRLFRTTAEMICICGQTLIICFWGEQILQESRLVGNAVFESDFFGTDIRFQKGLVLIMCRSQRPTAITARKFAVICLSTFAWVLDMFDIDLYDTKKKVKDGFYENLTKLLSDVHSRKEIVLMGDLNARTGTAENSNIVGKHAEEAVNDKGLRLIELCETYSLKILNGFYRHKNIHKYA